MEEIIPRLATALGDLRRAPGGSDGWIDHILRTFERERPDGHVQLRRRLGFARRLANLAGIPDEAKAELTVGLFFAALVGDSPPCDVRSAPQRWMKYLLRNEAWLAPSLHLAQCIESSEPVESMAVEVARTAVTFDMETVTRGIRPLQAIQSIRDKADTEDAERVAQLLWLEAGQDLCDNHVRHRGQQYALEASDIKEYLDLLRPDEAPPTAEQVETPVRLGTALSLSGAKSESAKGVEPRVAALYSETFERHRRALRLGPGLAGLPDVGGWYTNDAETGEPVGASETDDAVDSPNAAEERQLHAAAESAPEAAAETTSSQPSPSGDAEGTSFDEPGNTEPPRTPDTSERLEELRIQLQQIELFAVRGQEFLASLAAELAELSAREREPDSPAIRLEPDPQTDTKAA